MSTSLTCEMVVGCVQEVGEAWHLISRVVGKHVGAPLPYRCHTRIIALCLYRAMWHKGLRACASKSIFVDPLRSLQLRAIREVVLLQFGIVRTAPTNLWKLV